MAEVKNYKRKPTVVQAIQFTGNNLDELREFGMMIEGDPSFFQITDGKEERQGVEYFTQEGKGHLETGDYIVKGVDGMSYPCNRKIFPLIYEETELPFKINEEFAFSQSAEEHHNEEN